VACSQGEVIPDLVARVAAADEVELPTISSAKGSTWALAFRDDRLVEAEYFPPPRVEECGTA